MFRLYSNSRAIYGLCRSFSNQIGKRYQSSSTTGAANIALEPNTSKMSIFSGHIKGGITNNLEFIRPENITPLPIYQVLDPDGSITDKSQTPDVSYGLLEIKLISPIFYVYIHMPPSKLR